MNQEVVNDSQREGEIREDWACHPGVGAWCYLMRDVEGIDGLGMTTRLAPPRGRESRSFSVATRAFSVGRKVMFRLFGAVIGTCRACRSHRDVRVDVEVDTSRWTTRQESMPGSIPAQIGN